MASQITPSSLQNCMVSSTIPISIHYSKLSPREDDAGSVISMATAAPAGGSASSGIVGGANGHHRSFKGVVLQHNGHWGAQIYANHQRIWLGTFRTEQAAAMAYDSAAAKIFGHYNHHQNHPHHRNFPMNETTACEFDFQEKFSTEDVLAMIKDGSYQQKLAEFVRSTGCPCHGTDPAVPTQRDSHPVPAVEGYEMKEMFVKELTPSDVGKLNRLVIPKKHALRHLPPVSLESEEILLEFADRGGRAWVFRYCYWKSSQSYVFTKGWNKFVKEKGLRPKDVVGFYWCVKKDGLRRSCIVIDVVKVDNGEVVVGGGGERKMIGLELGLGREGDIEMEEEEDGDGDGDGEEEMEEEEEVVSPMVVSMVSEEEEKKEVMLFGVRIG